MLTELCRVLRNWFDVKRIFGTFKVSNGTMEIDGAQSGQYVRICDSIFNDGVYEYPLSGLTDETFEGAVWLLAIPKEVVELSREIDAWNEKYAEVLLSPYTSESFAGYSYSKSGVGTSNGTGATYLDVFADKLNKYRKI